MSTDSTKQKILDVATELVAAKGTHDTTIREIVLATGSNVAAVNYHFGAKDALIQQVMVNIFEPVNAQRMELLRQFEQDVDGQPVPMPRILEALLRPIVYSARGRDGGSLYVRANQHLRAQPGSEAARFVMSNYDHVAQAFIEALQRALPDFTRAEIIWRYEFVRGASIHLMLISDPRSGKLRQLSHDAGMIDLDDRESVLKELLEFSIHGFRAPPAWNRDQLIATRPLEPAVRADV